MANYIPGSFPGAVADAENFSQKEYFLAADWSETEVRIQNEAFHEKNELDRNQDSLLEKSLYSFLWDCLKIIRHILVLIYLSVGFLKQKVFTAVLQINQYSFLKSQKMIFSVIYS